MHPNMLAVFLAIFAAVVNTVIIIVQKKRQKPWSELTDREKKIKIGLLVVIALLVIVGITSLLFI